MWKPAWLFVLLNKCGCSIQLAANNVGICSCKLHTQHTVSSTLYWGLTVQNNKLHSHLLILKAAYCVSSLLVIMAWLENSNLQRVIIIVPCNLHVSFPEIYSFASPELPLSFSEICFSLFLVALCYATCSISNTNTKIFTCRCIHSYTLPQSVQYMYMTLTGTCILCTPINVL